jgi:beta-glucosidase
MGLSPLMEGEEGDVALSDGGGDRNAVELPPSQVAYLRFLTTLGKKLILVLTGGSPIALPEEAFLADAILMAWYPGEEGGNAVADVLFGEANPGGRLPITFPSPDQTLPPIEDYRMDGRTYRFQRDEPQFRFGFGLSYTTFAYSELSIEREAATVTVSNTGPVAGDEVVQLYVRDLDASTRVPFHALWAFRRVSLAAGGSKTIELPIPPNAWTVVLDDGQRVVEPGEFEVFVGGGQPGTEVVVSQRITL